MANTLTQWRPGFWYYFDENGYEIRERKLSAF